MTFEFVIVYQHEDGVNIRDILLERLRLVLTDNLNEIEDEATSEMLSVDFERRGEPVIDECDEAGIVCDALAPYEERLESFFDNEDEDL